MAGALVKLPTWLRDRRVQLGVAGAAVLGLVALVRRGHGPGAGGVDDGEGSTPQSITPAVMDSSGTDIYNAISSLGQGWQNDLREYNEKLDNLSSQIGKLPQTPATGPTPPATVKPPPATVKPPVKVPPKKPAPKYTTVGKWRSGNTPWNSTLSGIAKHFNTTVGKLMKLNPKIKNANVIHAGQKIRVK